MSWRASVVVPVLLSLCACEPAVEPVPVTVGVHDVEFVVPDGWEHFDRGREQRFERDIAQISLTDLGPVTPEGFLREIAEARGLFRRGQLDDAQTVLFGLQPRRLFPNEERWTVFARPWRIVRKGGQGLRPDRPEVVDRAYEDVLAQIAALRPVGLEAVTFAALAKLDHDERRDVAEREPLVIDGRQALRVDTWDRLSHDLRKRHVFILNENNLLVGRMELGRFAEMQPAFDALLASLKLPSG